MTAPAPMEIANALHRAVGSTSLKVERVRHNLFRQYSLALRRLMEGLGVDCEGESWALALAALRRYRFQMSSAPLAFNAPAAVEALAKARVENRLAMCNRTHPSASADAQEVLRTLQALKESSENPFLEALNTHAAARWFDAFLVPSRRLVEMLGGQDGRAVLSTTDLRLSAPFGRMALFGARGWFPEHVFNAPRAQELILYKYEWVRDSWPEALRLPGTPPHPWPPIEQAASPLPPQESITAPSAKTAQPSPQELDIQEVARSVDWNWLSMHARADRSEDLNCTHEAESWIIWLESDAYTLIGAAEGSTALILDPEADPKLRLQRIPTDQVRNGTFLVFYESGGQTTIAQLSDAVAPDAADAKKIQEAWKAKLTRYLQNRTAEDAATTLTLRTGDQISPSLVQSWKRQGHIRPQKFEWFLELLRLWGDEKVADDWWAKLGGMQLAHQVVGQRLREHCIDKLLAADLSRLQAHGKLTFSLPDLGSTVTVLGVLDTSPDTFSVKQSKLGHLFRV